MKVDTNKLAAWTVLGAGGGILVALVSAGQSDARLLAGMLNNPMHFLPIPAAVGAACGAAIAVIKT